MRVDINSLSCTTALEHSEGRKKILLHQPYSEGAPVALAQVERVLYLPNVLDIGQSICVTLSGLMPSSAILDQWTLDFVKKRLSMDPKANYQDEFEADASSLNVCILGNVFSRNFGHWTEEMIKVCALEHVGFDGHYVISSLPGFSHDLLRLLGISDERVVDITRPTIFKSAVFITPVDHSNIDRYPQLLFLLRDSLLSKLPSIPDRYGENIWLDRISMVTNGGILLNREEVLNCLTRYGFTAVDMGTLPVANQLSVAKNMRVACGVTGSQFVHVQFMPVESTVVECFSPCYVNPSVIGICAALRHNYHQIVAIHTPVLPYQHGRDAIVDCKHLQLVLQNALGE